MSSLKKSVKRKHKYKRLQFAVYIDTISIGNDIFPLNISLPHVGLSEWNEVLPQKLEGCSLITKIASDLCMSYGTSLKFDTRCVIERCVHLMLNVDDAMYYRQTMTRRRLLC
jgi:hypothetical protein